ncbi:MAG: JAB domain-containing protein [Mobilitalea sp.]
MPKKAFKLEVVSIRLVKDAPLYSDSKIDSPNTAAKIIGGILCEMDREVVCLVNLKSDNTPINCSFVSMGAINQAIVHPRELFKTAILSNAANMLLLHCHPSGNLQPSKEDIRLTDRLIHITELMGIPLLDHIIVGGDNHQFFSMKEKGMMSNPGIYYASDYHILDFGEQIKEQEVQSSERKGR